MYLSRALSHSLAPPDWVSVNLTLRCNLKCTMCTTCYDQPDELSTEEVKDIIDQTALWGVKVFNPLGGEPFVRQDLEEILAYACARDFHITITTNGTLILPSRARRIADIPSDKLHFNISIDGAEVEHDGIRGAGNFAKTLAGYRELRQADARAGNPRRKILSNTLIHAKNLHNLPELLDQLAEEGFDGVQLLNLFRHGKEEAEEIDRHGLWIQQEDYPALEALVEELSRRVREQGPPGSGFRILNSEEDLRLIRSYYEDALRPLEAPCWSGWKELYINSDGRAIMCDGQLEFLEGSFGSSREQTLRQLWSSEALRERRQVVKSCKTPCMQSCYLRRDSDSARTLLRGAASLALEELRQRLGRRGAQQERQISQATLTLELSDVSPWSDPQNPAPKRHFEGLVAKCPAPFEACYEDPFQFYEYRNRGYLNFDRGFLGFEIIRKIFSDLSEARLRFGALRLDWRGEPLLHPEFVPVLRFVLESMEKYQAFERLVICTDARLLNTEIADVASYFGEVPQTWILHGNAAEAQEEEVLRNVDYFLHVRKPAQRWISRWTVYEDLDPHAFVETWKQRLRDPVVAVGAVPDQGDAIHFEASRHHHYQADQDARQRLLELAEVLDVPFRESPLVRWEAEDPAFCTPVVSWDAKLTLCRRDRGLAQRAGEVDATPLPELWDRSEALQRGRRASLRPGKSLGGVCPDCFHLHEPPAPGR